MSTTYRPSEADDDYVVVHIHGDQVVGVSFGERILPFETEEVTASGSYAWREVYDNNDFAPLVGVELDE